MWCTNNKYKYSQYTLFSTCCMSNKNNNSSNRQKTTTNNNRFIAYFALVIEIKQFKKAAAWHFINPQDTAHIYNTHSHTHSLHSLHNLHPHSHSHSESTSYTHMCVHKATHKFKSSYIVLPFVSQTQRHVAEPFLMPAQSEGRKGSVFVWLALLKWRNDSRSDKLKIIIKI